MAMKLETFLNLLHKDVERFGKGWRKGMKKTGDEKYSEDLPCKSDWFEQFVMFTER